MKKQILFFGQLVLSTLLFSQVNVDSLVDVGIKYHDNGQYEKAIETYKSVLEIEPNSALVNYEISMTYMYAKDFENAIIHSDKVIELNDKYLLPAYITKGSCLDYLGKTKESIKLFEKGIKKFGDHYLLYYNMGYNYYNLEKFDKAEEALVNAINTKSSHASSHLLLGYLMADKNQKVKSLLCLHYFLFLEASSERAKTSYGLLQKQFGGNSNRDKDKPDQINILFDPNQEGDEFSAANLMISVLDASKFLEENKGKSEEELFIENTTTFFKTLGELKTEKHTGLWWEFYVPFFYDIANSEHIVTYCYYISQSANSTAKEWLNNNENKLEEFDKWLKEH